MGLHGPSQCAYALPCGEMVLIKRGASEQVLTVDKVERRWKSEERLNGQGPCLVFFRGEPRPWFFESGHDRVTTISQSVAIDF